MNNTEIYSTYSSELGELYSNTPISEVLYKPFCSSFGPFAILSDKTHNFETPYGGLKNTTDTTDTIKGVRQLLRFKKIRMLYKKKRCLNRMKNMRKIWKNRLLKDIIINIDRKSYTTNKSYINKHDINMIINTINKIDNFLVTSTKFETIIENLINAVQTGNSDMWESNL